MTIRAAEITAAGKYRTCHMPRIVKERGLHKSTDLHLLTSYKATAISETKAKL